MPLSATKVKGYCQLKGNSMLQFYCIIMLFVFHYSNAYASEQSAVLDIFEKYTIVLKSQEREQLFPYLNGTSLSMMKTRPYSGGMMKKEAQTIAQCGKVYVKIKHKRAVLYFSSDRKMCNPYFVQLQQGHWRIDLHTMSKAIRFDHSNHWHLNRSAKHPYIFAF